MPTCHAQRCSHSEFHNDFPGVCSQARLRGSLGVASSSEAEQATRMMWWSKTI